MYTEVKLFRIQTYLISPCRLGGARQSSLDQQTVSPSGLEVGQEYEKVNVLVEYLSQDASQAGLSRSGISERVNSRLNKARLTPVFDDDQVALDRYLYVQINVGENVFGVNLKFQRVVLYLCDTMCLRKFAATWEKSCCGIWESAEHILEGLDRLVDQFLFQYLKENRNELIENPSIYLPVPT